MNLLVIGSGAREHAIAWKLSQSARVGKVFVAPGNAGTALEPGLQNMPISDIPVLVEFARRQRFGFTVVGPEAPLAAGVVNAFQEKSLPIFGPTREAAQLESSKAFAKAFMQRHNIPTGRYATFTDAAQAHAYLDQVGAPIVVKADGLAAGKGVVVANSSEEAHAAVDAMLEGSSLGEAGARVVIEEFLRGGMGAYSPAPVVTPTVHARVLREIITPTVQGLKREGTPYVGFLYAGLMIDADGNPKVLEFNCRLGDPETQPIMLRLRTDLSLLIEQALKGRLHTVEAQWDRRAALAVVLASQGYPDSPRKGDLIRGLARGNDEWHVFHAGTRKNGEDVVTNGGRVLSVAALGESVRMAKQRAYEMANGIQFAGRQMRTDIGNRAIPASQR